MNSGGSGPIGGIYDKLREESSIGTEIELESRLHLQISCAQFQAVMEYSK